MFIIVFYNHCKMKNSNQSKNKHSINIKKLEVNSKEQKMRAKDELDSEKKLQDMRDTFDSCAEQIGLGNVPLLKAKEEPSSSSKPSAANPAPSPPSAAKTTTTTTTPASEADDDTPKTQKTLTDAPRTALQC